MKSLKDSITRYMKSLKETVYEAIKHGWSPKQLRRKKQGNPVYGDSEHLDESIQYLPKRRLDKSKCYDLWEKAYELLGGEGKFDDQAMLQEIFNYLDDNTCSWILEELDKDYELGIL